jgi:hypothetical protein
VQFVKLSLAPSPLIYRSSSRDGGQSQGAKAPGLEVTPKLLARAGSVIE